jgi:hypothetical protein
VALSLSQSEPLLSTIELVEMSGLRVAFLHGSTRAHIKGAKISEIGSKLAKKSESEGKNKTPKKEGGNRKSPNDV